LTHLWLKNIDLVTSKQLLVKTANFVYMEKIAPYQSKHKIRILTAGSLFDGHDAAINIMRRIIQRSGA